jgi:hypothetical protein
MHHQMGSLVRTWTVSCSRTRWLEVETRPPKPDSCSSIYSQQTDSDVIQ